MMQRKVFLSLAIVLGIAFIFNVSCGNLAYSNLKGNYHVQQANGHYAREEYDEAAKKYIEAIKAKPDFIPVYQYLGSCYRKLFKDGLPYERELVDKMANKLFEVGDNAYLRELVYEVNMKENYDEMKSFIDNLKIPDEYVKKQQKQMEIAEQEKKEEKVEKKGKKDKTKDKEKVKQIIAKWEKQIKADEEIEEEKKESEKKSPLLVTQPSEGDKEGKKVEETEEGKTEEDLTSAQKVFKRKNTLRGLKALANIYLIKQLDSANIDSTLTLSQLYDSLQMFGRAEKYYLEIAERYKTSDAYYKISEFYSNYGKEEKAMNYLNKAISMNPNDPNGYLRLANYYRDNRKYDGAIEAHEKRIEILENKDASKKILAEAYYSLGFNCWSKAYVKKYVEYLNQEERRGYMDILRKGLDSYDKAIKHDPDYAYAYIYKSLIYRQMMRFTRSRAQQQKFLAQAERLREKYQEVYDRVQRKQKAAEKLKELEKGNL